MQWTNRLPCKFFWHCKNSGKIEKRERNHVSLNHSIPSYTYSHKLLLKWRVNDINLDIHSKLKSSLNFWISFSFLGRIEVEWKHVVYDLYVSFFLQIVRTVTFRIVLFTFYFWYTCNVPYLEYDYCSKYSKKRNVLSRYSLVI